MRLRHLADRACNGLTQTGPDGECWDVWLQPRVMQALQPWRESLRPADRAQAARIAGQLVCGQRVTPATRTPWQLAWCCHRHAPAHA